MVGQTFKTPTRQSSLNEATKQSMKGMAPGNGMTMAPRNGVDMAPGNGVTTAPGNGLP